MNGECFGNGSEEVVVGVEGVLKFLLKGLLRIEEVYLLLLDGSRTKATMRRVRYG